jgi:hypothetical protein
MKGLGKAVIFVIRPKPHEVPKTVGKCVITDSFKRRCLAKRKSLIRGSSHCRTTELIKINLFRLKFVKHYRPNNVT